MRNPSEMQVARRRIRVRGGQQVDSRRYPHRIQMYTLPPTEEITLEDFENFGYDRLKGISRMPVLRDTFHEQRVVSEMRQWKLAEDSRP